MINDRIFTFTDVNGVTVFPVAIRLDIDRGIYLKKELKTHQFQLVKVVDLE